MRAFGKRSIIDLDGKPDQTDFGLHYPADWQERKPHTRSPGWYATIIQTTDPDLKRGDRVVVERHTGRYLEHGDKEVVIIDDEAILAIVENV